MKIIDTTESKATTAVVELQKPIGSFLFGSSLPIDKFTTETINIRIIRPNKGEPILVHNEDIPLAAYLLAATLTGNPIGSNLKRGFQTQCLIPLTIGGNIPISDNDVIRFEVKGLSKTATYVFEGLQASYNGVHAMTYVKKNAPKDNTSIDFAVQAFDLAVVSLTDDLTNVDIRYTNGFLATFTIQELKDQMNRTFGVAQILSDGTCTQEFQNFLQIPLVGIHMLTFKKDNATSVTNVYLRNNVLN
jgi:hypothetical protein